MQGACLPGTGGASLMDLGGLGKMEVTYSSVAHQNPVS